MPNPQTLTEAEREVINCLKEKGEETLVIELARVTIAAEFLIYALEEIDSETWSDTDPDPHIRAMRNNGRRRRRY